LDYRGKLRISEKDWGKYLYKIYPNVVEWHLNSMAHLQVVGGGYNLLLAVECGTPNWGLCVELSCNITEGFGIERLAQA
jgi:hypothetical protein